MRLGLLLAALGVALVISACGSDPAEPAGPAAAGGGGGADNPAAGGNGAPESPCDLFSRDEAAGVAGNPVKEGQELGFLCIWEPEDIGDDANVQLSLGYVPVMAGGDAQAVCQASLEGIPDAKPFPGIGDSAYWDFESGARSNTGSLHVCFEKGMLDTSAIGQRPEAELQQIAVSIANTAMGRL